MLANDSVIMMSCSFEARTNHIRVSKALRRTAWLLIAGKMLKLGVREITTISTEHGKTSHVKEDVLSEPLAPCIYDPSVHVPGDQQRAKGKAQKQEF